MVLPLKAEHLQGCFYKLGVPSMGVPTIRAVPPGVYIRASDSWELTHNGYAVVP